MINFSNANFIKSASKLCEAPGNKLPEVLLCGKSNVGKSSFINAITVHKSLAYTSSKPGHTKLLNYYDIDNSLYLVDAPGYGYASGGFDLDKLFGEMMDDYFKNPNLKLVLVLLDSRRELSDDDIELINYIDASNVPYYFIFTKADKLNQKEKAKILSHIKELGISSSYYFTSSLDRKSFDPVKGIIEQTVKQK